MLQIVCEFPWYQLSAKHKKVYLQFIQICQHTPTIRISIFGDLGMELLKHLANCAYSYAATMQLIAKKYF